MNSKKFRLSTGGRTRALILSLLLVSLLAGAVVPPVMAASGTCNACSQPDENGFVICTQQYCPVLPDPFLPIVPKPPCCIFMPDGQVFCMGLGYCTMDPVPFA